jgi:hypothetical protein
MIDRMYTLLGPSEILPSLMFWIKVGDLQFDERYSRPVRKAWLKRTKPEFHELRLGPILVNQRRDLSLWCFDGRSRVAAVRELFGADEEVLCRVTPHDDPAKRTALEVWTKLPPSLYLDLVPWAKLLPDLGPDPEVWWEAEQSMKANGRCGKTRTQRKRQRALYYSPEVMTMWQLCCAYRRSREVVRDAAGGVGPVPCDRLVPGYAIGDPYYAQWEQDLIEAHRGA